jgi:hypothetical protein
MSSVSPVDNTSLAAGNFNQTVILNDIFKLLTRSLTAIQNVAATQAQSLQFFAQWQNYYTSLMAQVPNPTQFANLGSSAGAKQAAAQFNTTLITKLQNRQSIIADQTKAMQTVVNQSNDAASAQANLGSSLLQEMTTLLPIVMGQS